MRIGGALAAAGAALVVAAPATEAAGGRIAFLSDRGGPLALWAVDEDGTGLRRLTDARTRPLVAGLPDPDLTRGVLAPSVEDDAFSWSPDGARLAFSGRGAQALPGATREGYAIFTTSADGGPAQQISPVGEHHDVWPHWSPDGRRIAFGRLRADGPFGRVKGELWVHDLATGEQRRVAPGVPTGWSADGARLATVDVWGGPAATVGADGTDRRTLAYDVRYALWAPSGRRLAALTTFGERLVLLEDGAGRVDLPLTTTGEPEGPDGGYACCLTWSPDGRELGYLWLQRERPTELRARPAGAGPVRLVTRFASPRPFMSSPAWSPDGRSIAIGELVEGRGQRSWSAALSLIPSGGGGARRVVDDRDRKSFAPGWRPEPGPATAPVPAVAQRRQARRRPSHRCPRGTVRKRSGGRVRCVRRPPSRRR